ncbi:MAG: SDR family NAD(P)-dependent oxidoreductase [Deltaproteobacteria bacterium]|nr:SDR family NAD(P)-dependent oxidoreductase [Deltaproteobacteria bacterium]
MALNLDAIGRRIGPLTREYTWRDVVLYALGVGAGFEELDYVYENRLKVLPSFSIASVFEFLAQVAAAAEVDLTGILHGEQDIVFHRPIPAEGRLVTEGAITHIWDKGPGKGALVVAQADTFAGGGAKLFTNVFTLFCKKDGGFGGEPGTAEAVEIPGREPDYTVEDQPATDQPLLYRLSGDIFTLHVDPEFAKAAGFDMPIMHGLCTHGYACRHVIASLMPGRPELMRRFKVRFAKPLYPGQPIATKIWQTGEQEAVFQTVNAATGEVVLDQGLVTWASAEEAAARAARGDIDFAGRVALVTGAGAGLGRAYALQLARRGAKVVVNDLGVARDGQGGGSRAADQVVAEIRAAGGEAVADCHNVAEPAGGEAMVAAAMENFGRLDVVINNAGILRDKTLLKMAPEDWRAVQDVHLTGAYNVTRPAFLQMKEQGYGRIIFTTSAAGLYGNFGQTNYGAAKLGLVGFLHTLKLEGESAGVLVNAVAPLAGTRLTEDVLPPELYDKLKPEFVTPLVLYLASEQCPVTGHVYNAGLGVMNRAAVVTGPGAVLGDGENPPTPEEVAAAWSRVTSLDGAELFDNANAALSPILAALEGGGAPAPAPAAAGPSPANAGGPGAAAVFAQMPRAFQADRAGGVKVVFQFELTGEGGGNWYADIADGVCQVSEGAHPSPTTTIKMAAPDFLEMIAGRLNPMTAYTSGKLKIGGDLMKSQLITKLFKF